MDNIKLAKLLTESAQLLDESVNYTVERGNLLYADDEFIGSFDNNREKQELIDEYEEEHKDDK